MIGLALIGLAMWGGSGIGVSETGESRQAVPWFTHFVAGVLALGGLFVAQQRRARRLGQVALVAAAAILIGALVLSRYVGAWGWLTLVLPAVLLVVAAFLLRPMPPPDRGELRQHPPSPAG